jgi:hypothetical protein
MNIPRCPGTFETVGEAVASEGRQRRPLQHSACSSYQRWHTSREQDCARRGGRAVDCAGLEIRFEDFGLNWTQFARTVLVVRPLQFLTPSRWTIVVAIIPIFFLRVTFLV